MSTQWVVSTAAERFTLDSRRQAETTFTVTNPSGQADRAIFEVVTDSAAMAWFTVDEPQRLVPAAASVPYVLRVAVPTDAPAGQHAVQGRVYSADSAPEETSALSNRVLLDVPSGAPRKPAFRWWWLAIPAALIVIAAVVVTVVVVSGPAAQPDAAPTGAASVTVAVPDLSAMTEADAVAALEQAGLVPTVKHRHDPANVGVVTQSLPAGTEVARGSAVEMVVTVALKPPTLVSPADNAVLPGLPADPVARALGVSAARAQVTWTQEEPYVTTWRVVIAHDSCIRNDIGASGPGFSARFPVVGETVSMTSLTTVRSMRPQFPMGSDPFSIPYTNSCGSESWQVAAVDDFGNIGPFGGPRTYRIGQ